MGVGGLMGAGGLFCVDDPQLKGKGRRGRRGRRRQNENENGRGADSEPCRVARNGQKSVSSANQSTCMHGYGKPKSPTFPTPTHSLLPTSPPLSFRPYVLAFVLRPWFVSTTAVQSMLLIVDRFYITLAVLRSRAGTAFACDSTSD